MLLFHGQRENTEHVHIKCHISNLFLIEGIECVTIASIWKCNRLQITSYPLKYNK